MNRGPPSHCRHAAPHFCCHGDCPGYHGNHKWNCGRWARSRRQRRVLVRAGGFVNSSDAESSALWEGTLYFSLIIVEFTYSCKEEGKGRCGYFGYLNQPNFMNLCNSSAEGSALWEGIPHFPADYCRIHLQVQGGWG